MNISPNQVTSVHEEVSWRGQAAIRILLYVQAQAQDIIGAVDEDQRDVALMATRRLSEELCTIASLPDGGSLRWGLIDVCVDPYRQCPEAVLRLIDQLQQTAIAYVEDATPGSRLLREAESVVSFVIERLDLADDLPEMGSPSGLFEAISLARGLLDAGELLGLPAVLPQAWLGTGGSEGD